MYSRAIEINNAVLTYSVQGSGSRALLLFHGAGQDRSVFNHIPDSLGAQYRLYAFDLFFHGDSKWMSDQPITKQRWKEIIEAFAASEQVERWSVLGYSIGARFALATLEMCPQRTQMCFLIAPDGIPNNPWFSMATGTAAGRMFFRMCLQSPRLLSEAVGLGAKLRMVDTISARFIEHQLDTEAKRQRLFNMWTSFRKLDFTRRAVTNVFNRHRIPLHVYAGTRDRLISVKGIRRFLTRLKSSHLEVIDMNHRRILTEALERMARG